MSADLQLDIFDVPAQRSRKPVTLEERIDASKHPLQHRVVVDVIREVAAAHDGVVDQNLVRPLIPSWVQSKVVGSTYSMMRAAHVLDGDSLPPNKSTDREGGNAGRWQPVYRWVGVA